MCLSPYIKTDGVPVPCGKCPPCVKRRSNGWAFRLKQQDRLYMGGLFITLTYNDENIPLSPKNYMTLDRTAFPRFMKRLRKLHYQLGHTHKLSYYHVGEYGSKRERPHYHAIIFGTYEDLIHKAWMLDNQPIGDVHIGQVSEASIAYTVKYMHKGKIIPKHRNDDRIPEFSSMSKKIGANYITDQIISWHREDLNRNYVVTDGGHKVAMPRYYRERIFQQHHLLYQQMNIQASQQEQQKHKIRRYIERTGDRNLSMYAHTRKQTIISQINNFRLAAKNSRNI